MIYKRQTCPKCGIWLPEEGKICPACGCTDVFEEIWTAEDERLAQRAKDVEERGEAQILKEEAEQRTYDAIREWICNIGPVVVILGALYYFGLLGMIWDLIWMILSMPFRNGS